VIQPDVVEGHPYLRQRKVADVEYSPRAAHARLMRDDEYPWWAIMLLDLSQTPRHQGVRQLLCERGARPAHWIDSRAWWEHVADLLQWAQERVMTRPLADWLAEAERQTDPETWEGGPITELLRDAALRSPNAFSQLVGLADEEGYPIVFKKFHIAAIHAMRQYSNAAILLPFEFGKSYLNNIAVPLMDWAEWRDASEGRIYWNETHSQRWCLKLMGVIERSQQLHQLFPWVDRPRKGDVGFKLWSTRGFSLRGRTQDDRAFEVLTANRFSTGNRYVCVGGDDWVNVSNAATFTIQDRLADYWRSGPETMAQDVRRVSPYGTAWPRVYYCGTLFDSEDCGSRIYSFYDAMQHQGKRGYRALRFDCYTDGTHTQTIWPEHKSIEHMEELKQKLGPRIFNMRCRNIVTGSESRVFPRARVLECEMDGKDGKPGFTWGKMPEKPQAGMIGFDPGRGRISKYSKHPAYFVYCQHDAREELPPGLLRDPRMVGGRFDPTTKPEVYHHGVEWGRLEGYSFMAQCDFLIAVARRYNLPVAVEDNNIQTIYAEQISRIATDVRIIDHTTGPGGADPTVGVEQFEPIFKHTRMILHAQGAPLKAILDLREELCSWRGRYTDIVMAMWIARHQAEVHFTRSEKPTLRLGRPLYLRRLA
jgi:hypothetical protein